MKHIIRHLRTKIFAGILVVLPIGITFLVLRFVFDTLDSILGPLFPHVSIYLFHRLFNIPGLGIIAFFFLLYLVGLAATNFLGRKVVHWAERLVINIPVVKNIYLSSKQLADAFSATRKGSFRQAVFVEFPQAGSFVLGFVTNELSDRDLHGMVTVFVATGFVPPAGFLLFLPREKVIPSQLTIEEAIKSIMSVGIVSPQKIPVCLSAAPLKVGVNGISEGIKYSNPRKEGGS